MCATLVLVIMYVRLCHVLQFYPSSPCHKLSQISDPLKAASMNYVRLPFLCNKFDFRVQFSAAKHGDGKLSGMTTTVIEV